MALERADVAVTGGILVSSQGMRRGDVFIKGGLVDSIEPPGSGRPAARVFDASGKFVLPGVIDAHNHPVYADRMDTLSVAAACGGITTVVCFIGAIKAWGKTGGLLDAAKDFIEEGEKASVIDFGAHCSLVRDDLETIETVVPTLVDLGVVSYKAFMAYAKRGMKLEDHELLRVMEVMAANRALFAVHAENGALIDYLQDRFVARGQTGPEYYYPSQPNLAEAEAAFRSASLASVARCPLYLVHLSARQSLEVVRLFRRWGEPTLFAETCLHYLTLTNEDVLKRGSLGKVGPPLREKADVEAMWAAVEEGLIDVVGSDFAGYMVQQKEPVRENIFKAPSGLPGIGDLLTLMYHEGINTGRITLPRLVALLCENPARIFGLYPKKGVLKPGSDADLVLFDPTVPHTIPPADPHLKTNYNMYAGRECLGAPTLVMQRGKVIVENGELKATPGQGRYLPRKLVDFGREEAHGRAAD